MRRTGDKMPRDLVVVIRAFAPCIAQKNRRVRGWASCGVNFSTIMSSRGVSPARGLSSPGVLEWKVRALAARGRKMTREVRLRVGGRRARRNESEHRRRTVAVRIAAVATSLLTTTMALEAELRRAFLGDEARLRHPAIRLGIRQQTRPSRTHAEHALGPRRRSRGRAGRATIV